MTRQEVLFPAARGDNSNGLSIPQIDPRLKLVGIGIDEVRFTRADFDEFFDTTVAQFAK